MFVLLGSGTDGGKVKWLFFEGCIHKTSLLLGCHEIIVHSIPAIGIYRSMLEKRESHKNQVGVAGVGDMCSYSGTGELNTLIQGGPQPAEGERRQPCFAA